MAKLIWKIVTSAEVLAVAFSLMLVSLIFLKG